MSGAEPSALSSHASDLRQDKADRAAPIDAGGAGHLRRALVVALVAVAAWEVVVHVTAALAVYGVGAGSKLLQAPGQFFDFWSRWDVGWYTGIADRGYADVPPILGHTGAYQDATAFPPAYPLILWVSKSVLHAPAPLAGVIIGPILVVVAVAAIYLLARVDFDEKTALLTVLFFLLWPSAVFFVPAYSEALLLPLTVLALLLGRHRRWGLAGVLTGLAVVTKITAVAIVVPLLVEAWMAPRDRRRSVIATLEILGGPVLAVALWAAYQGAVLHDPFRFLAAEHGWGRSLALPIVPLIGVVRDVVRPGLHPFEVFEAASLLFAIAMAVYLAVRVRLSYGLFVGAACLGLASTSVIISVNRNLLIAVPVFIGMAQLGRRHPLLVPVAAVPLAGLFAVILYRFATGSWAG
jgi:hypothetical protein